MAWENGLLDIGQMVSSGDMTGKQYTAVALSTANDENGAVIVAALGAAVDGVWQDNSTKATAGAMRVHGVTKMQALSSDVAISRGTRVVSDAAGNAYPSTAAGQHLVGISYGALSTGSSGIIPVMLTLGAIST